jgi:FtsH-binding integral membrane protein
LETRTVHTATRPRTTRNESIPRWSRSSRLTLGVLTLAIIVTFAGAALVAVAAETPATTVNTEHWVLFAATFMQYLLCLFYISFAAQNPRSAVRGWWIVGMVVLPWGVLPVYWWAHVWNAPYVSDPEHDYNVPGGQLTPHTD